MSSLRLSDKLSRNISESHNQTKVTESESVSVLESKAEQNLDLKSSSKKEMQWKLLSSLSAKLQALLESDNFYFDVVSLIQNHFNYYGIQIWMVDADGHSVLTSQAGAYNDLIPVGFTIRQGQGIVGIAAMTAKPYICNDVTKDSHYTSLSIPIRTMSELSVPVIQKGRVIAVINVESDKLHAFQEDDAVTIEGVAAQIGVAISNRSLLKRARDFSKTLQEAVDEKTRELQNAQERILEQQALLQNENKILRNIVALEQKSDPGFIGQSPAIQNVLSMVEKIAPTTATVLIQGESGTGKELIAKRIHDRSDRKDKAFVAINCGALNENLLESELFGHEKGSFTGAIQLKIGLAELANGGTLFLDEIGELPLSLQAKLLRFLQEGEISRVGGKGSIKVDVRVISATNRELEQEVKASKFREDLFFRLNTITLRLPPLRKRKEDVRSLIEHFLKGTKFGGQSFSLNQIDPRALECLINYEWPGNIRELQNTIERMKILCENNRIKLDDVPSNIRVPIPRTGEGSKSEGSFVEQPLEDVEKMHILRTLAFHNGNKTRAAGSLGITIKTLYNKLARYGIPVASVPGTQEVSPILAQGLTQSHPIESNPVEEIRMRSS